MLKCVVCSAAIAAASRQFSFGKRWHDPTLLISPDYSIITPALGAGKKDYTVLQTDCQVLDDRTSILFQFLPTLDLR